MKTIRRFFIMLLLSIGIAAVYYFIVLDSVIKSSLTTKLGELAVITLPVFAIVLLLYIVGRLLSGLAKSGAKKSLPNEEGLDR